MACSAAADQAEVASAQSPAAARWPATASGLPSSSNAARRWRLARTGPGVVSYSTSWTRPLANAKRIPLVTSSPARRARPASLPACSGSIPPRRATTSKSKVRPATAATRSSSSASGPTWRTRNSTAICSESGTAAAAGSPLAPLSSRSVSSTNAACPPVDSNTSVARSATPILPASSATSTADSGPSSIVRPTSASASSASASRSLETVAVTSSRAVASRRRRKCTASRVDTPAC